MFDALKIGKPHILILTKESRVLVLLLPSRVGVVVHSFNIAEWRGFVKRQLPFLTLSSGSAPIVGLLWKGCDGGLASRVLAPCPPLF